MKIALCYSGAIRSLSETLSNNLDAFSDFEIDLYFSVWDHMGYSDRINSPDYIFGKREIDFTHEVDEDLIRSIVKGKANIKNIKIEKYIPGSYYFNLINGIDNPGLPAQYYKIQDCFNLINDDYDFIVRIRCDMIINQIPDKSFILDCVKDNKIIFPSAIWYNHYKTEEHSSINEMLWISNFELMKKCCSIYHNTEAINDIIQANQSLEINYGEKITYMNLQAEKLVDKIELFNFDYLIVR